MNAVIRYKVGLAETGITGESSFIFKVTPTNGAPDSVGKVECQLSKYGPLFIHPLLIRGVVHIFLTANPQTGAHAGLFPFLEIIMGVFFVIQTGGISHPAITQGLQAQFMGRALKLIGNGIVFLQAGAHSRFISIIVARVVGHPGSNFSVGRIIGIVIDIALHIGTRVNQVMPGYLTFEGKCKLGEIIFQ